MNRQQLNPKNNKNNHFWQRRYGVSLGRKYVLAAASVVVLNVISYSQVGEEANTLRESDGNHLSSYHIRF